VDNRAGTVGAGRYIVGRKQRGGDALGSAYDEVTHAVMYAEGAAVKATGKLLATVLVAGAACTALTGCGGDKDTASTAPVVRPAAVTTTADTGPFAGESADRIVTDAEAATESATSMTMDLRTTGDDDEPVHATIALTRAGNCAGAVDEGAGQFQIIGVGSAYFIKASADFWREQGGSGGETLAKLAGGKWLKLPASAEKDGGFDEFCDMNTVMDTATAGDGRVVNTKGRVVDYQGRQVLAVNQDFPADDEDDEDDVMYVAATGTPYILKIYTPDDTGNVMTCGDFDKDLHIAAPPASQIVDMSAFDVPGFSI